MKLAILGSDPDIVQLVAAARDAGHEMVWLGDIRGDEDAALSSLVADRSLWKREWELLLAQGVVDGVIVGRGLAGGDLRAEQLKRLVVEAVPILVVHPLFESVLPYYEIDMTRRETGGIVQHFNPVMGGLAVAELAGWVRDGHPNVGAIQQVTCERHSTGASRSTVLAHLARDIELLAAVAGDLQRVSAIGPATLDASFASLQVQMTAANVPSLRWSVGSTSAGAAGMRLELLGEHGTVALRQSAAGNGSKICWQRETTSDDGHNEEAEETVDAARHAIDRFAAATESIHDHRGTASTWESATRDMEVVDAVELSLQKGRTIEVFQQQLTERLAFRGTMAALGCGLMLLAFIAVVGIAAIGGAEGVLGQRIAPGWSLVLLAVLAFFLLLQTIPMMVRKPGKRE